MDENLKLLIAISPLLILGIIGAIVCLVEDKNREKKCKQWKVVAEGVYDCVVYGKYDYTRTHRSGAMVHTSHTTYHVMKVTAIYFSDGRTCVLKGRHDIIFPKGTMIRVLENGLGERKIEKIESP